MHELMHCVGFGHEHTRPDRDDYIEILWDQIKQKWRPQYEIAKGSSLILSYDYGSVMHYPLRNEMKAKKHYRGLTIGQRNGLSEFDVLISKNSTRCTAKRNPEMIISKTILILAT
uniref:Metalloendopeptidase n=1 Tax=Daphnia galeata TaxID=27404 RepID=A0A8J2RE61_9CRUS|nr:unnamed protein product [Daphnia galeata]